MQIRPHTHTQSLCKHYKSIEDSPKHTWTHLHYVWGTFGAAVTFHWRGWTHSVLFTCKTFEQHADSFNFDFFQSMSMTLSQLITLWNCIVAKAVAFLFTQATLPVNLGYWIENRTIKKHCKRSWKCFVNLTHRIRWNMILHCLGWVFMENEGVWECGSEGSYFYFL